MHLYTFPSNHPFVQRSTTITSDAYFRIFTSLIGITTVDTHLALRAEADADSEILKLNSEQFADLLAGEMFGPRPPRQSTRLKRTVDTAVEEPPDTTCRLEGWPELKTSPTYCVRCTECKHKSTRYCVICGVAVCKTRKRGCFEKHVNTREELEAASRTSAVPIGMWSKRRKSL
jgi:hypothetical protein